MRWDFHSISQQESVLVDFHRQSNLPVTDITFLIRIVYLRGKALNSFFSKIGMSKLRTFSNLRNGLGGNRKPNYAAITNKKMKGWFPARLLHEVLNHLLSHHALLVSSQWITYSIARSPSIWAWPQGRNYSSSSRWILRFSCALSHPPVLVFRMLILGPAPISFPNCYSNLDLLHLSLLMKIDRILVRKIKIAPASRQWNLGQAGYYVGARR